tara:strand:+ start:148 stop:477 length:330 start_codon:yes stop_codon:yes gene_type:complete
MLTILTRILAIRHRRKDLNNLDYKPELECDIWQPINVKGGPDLNVKIRLLPRTERAQQRVEEYGDVMKLMHISHSGPFECNEEQILVMSLNEKWQGWFRNGTDVDFELT